MLRLLASGGQEWHGGGVDEAESRRTFFDQHPHSAKLSAVRSLSPLQTIPGRI